MANTSSSNISRRSSTKDQRSRRLPRCSTRTGTGAFPAITLDNRLWRRRVGRFRAATANVDAFAHAHADVGMSRDVNMNRSITAAVRIGRDEPDRVLLAQFAADVFTGRAQRSTVASLAHNVGLRASLR